MDSEAKLTILVTGFGPFRNYKTNASWEAVKLLPELVNTWNRSSNINLIIREIPVSYEDVTFKVKELWEKHKPSIIIHVGVSQQAECLTIEYQAHSKGYKKPDVHQRYLDESTINHVILKTKCSIEKICEIVNERLNKEDCKACISYDAGRYLCEYIYYQSLSIGDPQVLFVHVPELQKYPSIKTAKGLLEIIIQLVECEQTCDT